MHIRVSRHRRNGKSYDYAQLVESYRRPSDGTPAHRVIASLGPPDSVEVENFRAALEASRVGKRVAVVRQARTPAARPPKPTANLRYLELAVLLELWREWGLDTMLDELMPQGEAWLRPASVVAALVLQRCADPGSTLYASRWLPRTALPELLHFAPDGFNNTRLHRVLDDLDSATRSLMAKLPKRYEQCDGAFASLFMDVTDTWFVGDGPSLAAHGKTKEGLIQRKIGIVLLCNEHGLPLRWETISGTQADNVAMTAMLRSVAGLSWASQAPLVCDRAMGKTATIRDMLQTELRFVTAVTVTEFDAYAKTLPQVALATLATLDPHDEAAFEQHVADAAQRVEAAGMCKLEEDLFMLDLGIVERADVGAGRTVASGTDAASVEAMRVCREIEQAVKQGRFASDAAAGRALGIAKRLTSKYRSLGQLSEQQQRDVLEGKAAHCTLSALIAVASIDDADERQKAFELLIASPGPVRRTSPSRATSKRDVDAQAPIRVRVAAYFNPERFVHERLAARCQLTKIETFVARLRAKIAAAPGRYKVPSVAAAVDRELRDNALLETFSVNVSPAKQGPGIDIQVTLDAAEWARRRRYDGFTVLVAHPALTQSAADLCRLYRAKDAVEKDFQVIKSVVDLRPVWHHTDAKVRAHVTLCMLALLLERTLRRRLQALGKTAEAALDSLATCHLNHYAAAQGPGLYSITQLDPEQRAILKALRMLHLADDDSVADKIHPREAVVSTPHRDGMGKQGAA
jgi:hypothetical protein